MPVTVAAAAAAAARLGHESHCHGGQISGPPQRGHSLALAPAAHWQSRCEWTRSLRQPEPGSIVPWYGVTVTAIMIVAKSSGALAKEPAKPRLAMPPGSGQSESRAAATTTTPPSPALHT